MTVLSAPSPRYDLPIYLTRMITIMLQCTEIKLRIQVLVLVDINATMCEFLSWILDIGFPTHPKRMNFNSGFVTCLFVLSRKAV